MLPKNCTTSEEKYLTDFSPTRFFLGFWLSKRKEARVQKRIFSFDGSEWHFSWLPAVVNFGHMYHYHLGSLRTSLSLLLLCRRVVHTCSEELYGILASNGLWRRGAPFNVKREEGTRSPPLLFFPCCVGRKNPRAKASWIWALAEVSSLQWILKSRNL